MNFADHRHMVRLLALAFAASLAVFALWPQLDIGASALFYDPQQGFWLADMPLLTGLRGLVWNMSTAMVLLSLAAFVLAFARHPLPGIGMRRAGFVFLLYLLGPILLVNGVLKNHWGRARPADIAEFGGAHVFTPPYLPADQCAANCSFVSGEGSAAVALAISLFVFLPAVKRRLPRWLLGVYVALALVLPALGIGLRIATGRHFLSDTVFAALIVFAIAILLHRWLLHGRDQDGGAC